LLSSTPERRKIVHKPVQRHVVRVLRDKRRDGLRKPNRDLERFQMRLCANPLGTGGNRRELLQLPDSL